MSECEELIEKCDLLFYCLRKQNAPSKGMKRNIEVARKKGKEIRYIEDMLGYYPNVDEIIIRCGLAGFASAPMATRTAH